MAVIRMPQAIWERVHHHLYDTPGEHFAFLFAQWSAGETGPVFLVHDAYLVPEERTSHRSFLYELTIDAYLPAINQAAATQSALIEVHNHGGRHPRFSTADWAALPEFVSYALDSFPGRPYAATVWGDETVHGRWWEPTGGSADIRSVTVYEDPLRQRASHDGQYQPDVRTYDRQLAWFTEGGQANLARLRVAIVGLGGTGSHLAQQLVYLGVRDFILVDHDCAEDSNLNRLVTATPADLDTPKVVLARRLLKSVAPEAQVRVEHNGLPSLEALTLLKGADVIFGCVDDDGPRFMLNRIALAFGIPYFDVAVGIDTSPHGNWEIGGRVALVQPGGPCLHCMRELDLDEVQHWLRSPAQRIFAEERGYVSGRRIHAPAVVSLNGMVASTAVNEFAILASGTRPVSAFTELDLLGTGRPVPGQWSTIRRVRKQVACLECAHTFAGDRADLERFSRSVTSDDMCARAWNRKPNQARP